VLAKLVVKKLTKIFTDIVALEIPHFVELDFASAGFLKAALRICCRGTAKIEQMNALATPTPAFVYCLCSLVAL